jgi:hypothetical protein
MMKVPTFGRVRDIAGMKHQAQDLILVKAENTFKRISFFLFIHAFIIIVVVVNA